MFINDIKNLKKGRKVMKNLFLVSFLFVFSFFLFNCNKSESDNPISSGETIITDNADVDWFTCDLYISQYFDGRGYSVVGANINTGELLSYIGQWTNFTTYDNGNDDNNFELYCGLAWNIPSYYSSTFTQNTIEIRDLSNNIIYTHYLYRAPYSPTQGSTSYQDLNLNLTPGVTYQYRIQILTIPYDEDKNLK
jgi:hypothetical protein